MASQEELIVRIGADFDQLKKGLKGAGRETEKFGRNSATAVNRADKAIASLTKRAIGLATAWASVNGALSTFNSVLGRSKEITKFAGQLDLSRERFGAYSIIAREAGFQTEDMFDAMKDLSIKITDAANGAKSYEEVLNKIGLRSKELLKLNVEERFLAFANATSQANDALRQFALDELGSDPLLRFNKLIKESGPEIGNMADELLKSGKAMKELDYERIQEAAKAQRDLSLAWEQFANDLVSKFAPQITKALKNMSEQMTQSYSDRVGALPAVKEFAKKLKAEQDNVIQNAEEFAEKYAKVDAQLDPVTIVGQRTNLLQRYLEEQSEIRRSAREASLASQIDYNELVYSAERSHAERMTNLSKQGLKGRMEVAKGFFGSMSVLMQTENRKMFEVGKAAATANAVISTIESAQKAFNSMAGIPIVGPALGAAAAAAAVAAGMARVQAIQSTTMGGGGGFGGAGGAVSGGADASQQAPENVIDATFNLQTEQGFVSADQIRSVASGLNEYIEDGGRIRSVSVL